MRTLRMTGESFLFPFFRRDVRDATSRASARGGFVCVHGGVKTDFGAPATAKIDKT
jgi:hypothetical protein